MSESKFFKGGKSKAVKGLRRYIADTGVEFSDEEAAKLLFQHGETGDWGFDPDSVDDAVHGKKHAELEDANKTAADHTSEQEGQPEDPPAPDAEQEPEETPAPSVFAGMNHTLQNAPVHAPPAPVNNNRAQSRTSYTIEKNRPEQNGIKRPSAGGLCRAVWDAMDELRTSNDGAIPTSEQVRALAETKGWNKNNAMIEFYQWRKYNGIVGRTPKAAAPTE
jgi:hypothetical protein